MSENIFTHYGEEREVNCTDQEKEIFDIIRSACDKPDLVALTRKSDSYVSAVIRSEEYGPIDIARFKYSPRAKWIKIHPLFEKRIISSPGDIKSMVEDLQNAYQDNLKYL